MKLYRESIWREIVSSYESDSLAPSLLFSGPESSGRLSLALDLASFQIHIIFHLTHKDTSDAVPSCIAIRWFGRGA